ncbi:MAG: ABC transporter ATP-binding protein [Ruminococcaceae bacterium]|jgi:ABC-2 type transport system ATP-binding protein|nr:ABC transporter ATP-binding protein [Oscillospiraceae bacterium]
MSNILECKALVKRYGSKEALGGIDLALEPGRIVGLLGPNGSGKTTLIKLACGLLTPTGGEILIGGEKPSKQTNAIVSYLPERIALPLWMTTRQAMDFYGDFYADFRRDAAEEMAANLHLERDQSIKTMSKGTREKLQLILTMSRAAQLYLLDEPIGGVDPATRDYILKTILTNYSENSTVLISTHLISDVEHVLDEAVFLREGSVMLHETVDTIREEKGKSVDELFREVFAC